IRYSHVTGVQTCALPISQEHDAREMFGHVFWCRLEILPHPLGDLWKVVTSSHRGRERFGPRRLVCFDVSDQPLHVFKCEPTNIRSEDRRLVKDINTRSYL